MNVRAILYIAIYYFATPVAAYTKTLKPRICTPCMTNSKRLSMKEPSKGDLKKRQSIDSVGRYNVTNSTRRHFPAYQPLPSHKPVRYFPRPLRRGIVCLCKSKRRTDKSSKRTVSRKMHLKKNLKRLGHLRKNIRQLKLLLLYTLGVLKKRAKKFEKIVGRKGLRSGVKKYLRLRDRITKVAKLLNDMEWKDTPVSKAHTKDSDEGRENFFMSPEKFNQLLTSLGTGKLGSAGELLPGGKLLPTGKRKEEKQDKEINDVQRRGGGSGSSDGGSGNSDGSSGNDGGSSGNSDSSSGNNGGSRDDSGGSSSSSGGSTVRRGGSSGNSGGSSGSTRGANDNDYDFLTSQSSEESNRIVGWGEPNGDGVRKVLIHPPKTQNETDTTTEDKQVAEILHTLQEDLNKETQALEEKAKAKGKEATYLSPMKFNSLLESLGSDQWPTDNSNLNSSLNSTANTFETDITEYLNSDDNTAGHATNKSTSQPTNNNKITVPPTINGKIENTNHSSAKAEVDNSSRTDNSSSDLLSSALSLLADKSPNNNSSNVNTTSADSKTTANKTSPDSNTTAATDSVGARNQSTLTVKMNKGNITYAITNTIARFATLLDSLGSDDWPWNVTTPSTDTTASHQNNTNIVDSSTSNITSENDYKNKNTSNSETSTNIGGNNRNDINKNNSSLTQNTTKLILNDVKNSTNNTAMPSEDNERNRNASTQRESVVKATPLNNTTAGTNVTVTEKLAQTSNSTNKDEGNISTNLTHVSTSTTESSTNLTHTNSSTTESSTNSSQANNSTMTSSDNSTQATNSTIGSSDNSTHADNSIIESSGNSTQGRTTDSVTIKTTTGSVTLLSNSTSTISDIIALLNATFPTHKTNRNTTELYSSNDTTESVNGNITAKSSSDLHDSFLIKNLSSNVGNKTSLGDDQTLKNESKRINVEGDSKDSKGSKDPRNSTDPKDSSNEIASVLATLSNPDSVLVDTTDETKYDGYKESDDKKTYDSSSHNNQGELSIILKYERLLKLLHSKLTAKEAWKQKTFLNISVSKFERMLDALTTEFIAEDEAKAKEDRKKEKEWEDNQKEKEREDSENEKMKEEIMKEKKKEEMKQEKTKENNDMENEHGESGMEGKKKDRKKEKAWEDNQKEKEREDSENEKMKEEIMKEKKKEEMKQEKTKENNDIENEHEESGMEGKKKDIKKEKSKEDRKTERKKKIRETKERNTRDEDEGGDYKVDDLPVINGRPKKPQKGDVGGGKKLHETRRLSISEIFRNLSHNDGASAAAGRNAVEDGLYGNLGMDDSNDSSDSNHDNHDHNNNENSGDHDNQLSHENSKNDKDHESINNNHESVNSDHEHINNDHENSKNGDNQKDDQTETKTKPAASSALTSSAAASSPSSSEYPLDDDSKVDYVSQLVQNTQKFHKGTMVKFKKLLQLISFRNLIRNLPHMRVDQGPSKHVDYYTFNDTFINKVDNLMKMLAFNRIFDDMSQTNQKHNVPAVNTTEKPTEKPVRIDKVKVVVKIGDEKENVNERPEMKSVEKTDKKSGDTEKHTIDIISDYHADEDNDSGNDWHWKIV